MSTHPTFPLVRLARGVFAGALLALAGCKAGNDPNLAGPAFPDEKAQTATLDIQVVRDETRIRITNTTARAFGKSRVWINKWFSRDIEQFDVGQTLEFSLSEFRDQYGEAFRGGGFFATKKPERLVLAQLETADTLVGLVVVAREEE
jgi:hypothetical protein